MGKIKETIKKAILDFVGTHEGCSISTIQKELDLNYYAVQPIVKEMERDSLIILEPHASKYKIYPISKDNNLIKAYCKRCGEKVYITLSKAKTLNQLR